MGVFRVVRGGLCLLWLAAPTASAAVPMTVSWSDGLKFASEDKAFTGQIGGRIQQDWTFTRETDDVRDSIPVSDGAEFRRARLFVSGTLYGRVFFKSQWDFAGGKVVPKDVYMGVSDLPVLGDLSVGNQYEPFSLDETTSSKYISFVERGLTTVFAPSRNPGVLATRTYAGGRARWSAGVFRQDKDDGTSTGDGEYAETARLTGTPVRTEDGRRLLHVGVAASHRVPAGRVFAVSARPENHLGPKVLETATIAVDRVVLLSGEAALVAGSASLQGEVAQARLAMPGGEDPAFLAVSAFGSVFVTGEHRPYSSSTATFSRVKPKRNLGEAGGSGAVELLVRVSHLDLNDDGAGAAFGSVTDVTGGLNWYLNPMAKIMVNYVLGQVDRTDVDGDVHSLLTRFQIDF